MTLYGPRCDPGIAINPLYVCLSVCLSGRQLSSEWSLTEIVGMVTHLDYLTRLKVKVIGHGHENLQEEIILGTL